MSKNLDKQYEEELTKEYERYEQEEFELYDNPYTITVQLLEDGIDLDNFTAIPEYDLTIYSDTKEAWDGFRYRVKQANNLKYSFWDQFQNVVGTIFGKGQVLPIFERKDVHEALTYLMVNMAVESFRLKKGQYNYPTQLTDLTAVLTNGQLELNITISNGEEDLISIIGDRLQNRITFRYLGNTNLMSSLQAMDIVENFLRRLCAATGLKYVDVKCFPKYFYENLTSLFGN